MSQIICPISNIQRVQKTLFRLPINSESLSLNLKSVEPQHRKNSEKEEVEEGTDVSLFKADLGSLEKTKEGPNLKTSLKYLC